MVTRNRNQNKTFAIPEGRTGKLVLDGDYQGAEARVRMDIELGAFLDFQQLIDQERYLEILTRFADAALIEWNLTDKAGKPLPANAEGMKALPLPLAMAMIGAWMAAIQELPAPLGGQ